MSIEQIENFIALVRVDRNLQEQVKSAPDIDATVEIAKTAGFDITIPELIRFQAKATAELTDDELEKVAGGIYLFPYLIHLIVPVAISATLTTGAIFGVKALSD